MIVSILIQRGHIGAPILTQRSGSDPNLHFSLGGIVFPIPLLPRSRPPGRGRLNFGVRAWGA